MISGDYPYYHSPQELWHASTLVVEAALAPGPYVALHSFMPDAPDLREPVAIHRATITTPWKGDVAEGTTILVLERISATIDGIEYRATDIGTPMEPGQAYLLFLYTHPDAPHGYPAIPVSPVQGAYALPEGVPAPQADNDVVVTRDELTGFDPAAGAQDPRFAHGYLPGQGWEHD